MSPIKSFLLKYFAVYIIVGILINIIFGPPDYSKEYKSKYKADHDRYMEIVKSDKYKIWKENPRLEEQPAGVGFVEEYEANPDFIAEQRRRMLFNTLFDFFKVGMVLYLIIHFGRKPLCKFLDEQIENIKKKLEQGDKARNAAMQRRAEAQKKHDSLEQEKIDLEKERVDTIEEDRREMEELTTKTLAQIDAETKDRQQEEEHKAALLVKKELFTKAIDIIAEQVKENPSTEDNAEMFDQFIAELEKQR